ncbi:hypothetical protein [Paenibacillus sp. 598K]|uniref:hypothetical protein n=1 Tax=Paenibacillus sp. 598K TaxID=1117987 RepID=UPI001629A51E|nr:hypothetical protein [Paenibacillus sp. 598K]
MPYAYDINNSNENYDGLASWTVSGGYTTSASLWINQYYTSASKYTSSIKAGLTGHEIGHSLGLNHASIIQVLPTIMWPYTFNSDGTPSARKLTPGTGDISDTNSLYPTIPNFSSNVSPRADGTYVAASWAIYYKDEKELYEAADMVIIGKVTNENGSKFKKGDYSTYKSYADVKVKEVLKGDNSYTGKNIEISQMGGDDGSVKVIAEHSTHLKHNNNVILFLKRNSDNTYRPINEDDGIYIDKEGKGNYANIQSDKDMNIANLPR